MLYGVISRTDIGWPCGIDRDGSQQLMRNEIELMPLSDAEATAAKYGGEVVSMQRLFPIDFEVESYE